MRLHRLIGILLLMESRGTVKAKTLAEAFETTERTIYRDIDTLCEAGVPILSTSGPAGGYSLMDGYTIRQDNLHSDEVISLYLSGIGIHPVKHSEASINLKKSVLKLEKSLPAEYLPDIKIAKERFFYDPNIWWKEPKTIECLDLLRKAVWKSQKIIILYKKNSKNSSETTVRKIRSYGLVVKNMDWYLIAYCETRKGLRVYRCDRILEATLLPEETFTIPEDFNLEEFWKNWVNEFIDMIKKEPS
jgi:predicted DNA-binding transcriptional regulator YafY